ncbi:Protein of unknown function (DUF3626) [Seminavis robusta]|uniref:Uncharacterized protein n=1 Tax=Seminavis robusta TaxID=568900 RepID=A0A9N8EU55_9STRA|nr:Protein of unknown function (DUF3626) [Seminavis robusta]|eukprot:Sro1825_g300080.1 Protein of unknown function (DUF3626) (403) ;mRNA; r:20273-21585
MGNPPHDVDSLVVIDISSDDDDDVAVLSGPVAKKKEKPSGMDLASWKLIQQLQEDNDDVVGLSSRQMKRKNLKEREERDLEIARQLQVDEEQKTERRSQRRRKKLHQQENRDMVIAQQFQQDEDKLNKKHRKTPPSKQEVLDSLQPCQKEAIQYVTKKAKEMHDKSLPRLETRIASLGFSPEDLKQCLDYIQDDAPIVIHLKESTLSFLVKDTHYRNLFETSTSGGGRDKNARGKWESDMFGGSYNSSACTNFDKPKYGCLNVSGDIQGVNSARRYGNLFMILQPHVRYRSTFFNKDTGAFVATATLATHEFYAHVLDGYNDNDLSAVVNVCKSTRVGGTRSTCTTYKEVQIHGPVCLATDIQALSVPGHYGTAGEALKKDVLEFQKKANCNILWQGDLLNP